MRKVVSLVKIFKLHWRCVYVLTHRSILVPRVLAKQLTNGFSTLLSWITFVDRSHNV